MTISNNLSWVLGSWSRKTVRRGSLSGSLPLLVGVLSIDGVCGPHEVCSDSTWPLVTEMPSERDSWASDPEGSHGTHPTTNMRFNQALCVNECVADMAQEALGWD